MWCEPAWPDHAQGPQAPSATEDVGRPGPVDVIQVCSVQEPFRLSILTRPGGLRDALAALLSFLGLGAAPQSWGGMLSTAREQLFTSPWITIFPGFAIFVTVLGLNPLGDGLRDVLDPHTTRQRR